MPKLPSHMKRESQEFSEIRRQRLMYWEAYESILKKLDEFQLETKEWVGTISKEKQLDLGYVAALSGLLGDALDRISLEYTAGAPMEEIKGLYPAAVDAFEAWCKASDEWYFHRHPQERGLSFVSPFELDDAGSYLEMLRLLSLGVLLGEGEQLERIARLTQTQRKNYADTIIEELLRPYTDKAREVDALLHFDLYDSLIGAAWEEGGESAKCMKSFLGAWYKHYEGEPWHNAHERIGENEEAPHWANYYGYWSWEAGAIAYLYGLDDKSYRTHMVYPKDMVAWARARGPVPKRYEAAAAQGRQVLSAQPGQAVPQGGVWQTTAMLESRSLQLKAGDTLPKVSHDKSGNAVVWFLRLQD